MATIYTGPQPAQPQFQVVQQLQQQQQSPQSQDPLFEALVKYITSGPGPSAVSAAQIQSILDDHSNHRDYLESIVSPQSGDDIRIWTEHGQAQGFISTNMNSLTLHLTVTKPGNRTGFRISLHGQADGFYPPQVYMFDNNVFHWDTLDSTTPCTFVLKKVRGSFDNSYSVVFRPEVYTPENNKPLAEITLSATSLNLPDRDITGSGSLDVVQ